jgi:ribosome-associated protein
MRVVEITGDSIRLGLFLKYAALVDSGADAKALLSVGKVSVNGVVETRRGRQLVRGDEVGLSGSVVVVGAAVQ